VKAVPVFYSPAMCADSESFSPSAAKPAAVIEAWGKMGIPMEILEPIPLARGHFYKAHDKDFVDGILDLRLMNGFGNYSPAVAASLPYTSGSMFDAVLCAWDNGVAAVSPTSGFHHAGYDFAGGFCTFNGLMIAAMMCPTLDIGILDFDCHHGNGTVDIIGHFKMQDRITHYSFGKDKRNLSHRFLPNLAEIVKGFESCDVVIYQAGQDPHVDDPLGGYLTTEELFERDRIVFRTLREMGVPVAWNLAGGYTDPLSTVINGHCNTMKAFAEFMLDDLTPALAVDII